MKRRKTQIKTILVVLLALLLAFIWLHSMMPAEDSAEESQRVGQFLTPFLELFVGEGSVMCKPYKRNGLPAALPFGRMNGSASSRYSSTISRPRRNPCCLSGTLAYF